MTREEVLLELEALGNERTKKTYLRQGAREPLFGCPTGQMKTLAKQNRGDQALAEALYATGNYDAMYLAGMIADVKAMTQADFDRWMESAYCHMVADYIVSVTLAEADCAQSVADRWIDSGEDLYRSAGWSCYEWLLGWRADSYFDREKILALLDRAAKTIHSQSDHLRRVLNNFVIAVGVSYLPLREEALRAAREMGEVRVAGKKGSDTLPSAAEAIEKEKDKGRPGFKRRAVRC